MGKKQAKRFGLINQTYIGNTMTKGFIQTSSPKESTHIFTQRESEFLQQMIEGKSLSDIISVLNLSETTVYFYFNAIRKKIEALVETAKLN